VFLCGKALGLIFINFKKTKKMYDLEKTKQFIELRGKGNSLDTIAKTLSVSKSTLFEWSKKFEKEIDDLKKIELEEIKESLLLTKKSRLEYLSEVLKEVKTETKEQPMLMSYDKLVKLSLKIFSELDRSEYYDLKKNQLLNKKSEKEPELTEENSPNEKSV